MPKDRLDEYIEKLEEQVLSYSQQPNVKKYIELAAELEAAEKLRAKLGPPPKPAPEKKPAPRPPRFQAKMPPLAERNHEDAVVAPSND